MSFIIQRSRSELPSCMCHCDPPPGTEELAYLKMVCTIVHQLTRERSSVFSKPSEYSYPAMQDREGSREPGVRRCRRSFFLL